jgi:hypothetical protein
MILKNRFEEIYQYPNLDYFENKTVKYLLPTLGMRVNKLQTVVINKHFSAIDILRLLGLRGLYCYWKECPDKYNYELYMLFNPEKNTLYGNFSSLYSYLQTLPNFVKLYHANNNLIVIALRIDPKWQDAKQIIQTSKYSDLGKEFANHFFNNNGKLSKQFHIICKTDDYRRKLEIELGLQEDFLKGMELDSLFELEKETLDLEKLNIKFKQL